MKDWVLKMLVFHRILLVSISLTCWIGSAYASDFNIEDDTLSPLPAAALTAVRAHTRTTDYRECADGEFVGAAVDLTGDGRKVDWVAKTADGCAWGAATAVIWVLKREGNAYRVVLYDGGQVVSLKNAKSHSLRDLEIASGTAGHHSETHFKFNGKTYVQFKSREVNLLDPGECKANADVCGAK
jgi:hypothetical protein